LIMMASRYDGIVRVHVRFMDIPFMNNE
jgi:hypothetical protein